MSKNSNATFKRILSAVIGLPLYLYLIITDGFLALPILICSTVVSLICLYEFYQISDRGENGRPFVGAGMAMGAAINIVMYLYAFGKVFGYSKYVPVFEARVIMAVIVLAVLAVLVLQVFQRPLKGGIYSIAVTLLGPVYIVFFFSHMILIKSLAGGIYYLLLLNIVIMLNDIGAYFGGLSLGKHKTKFPASPNKSWEGYFSGLLFSIVGAIVINQAYISFYNRTLFTVIEAAVLGIILSVLGSVGDLVESAVKRDSAIKDSGSIIPGHGGMWDVFDAMIFSMPVFYYYLVLIGIP